MFVAVLHFNEKALDKLGVRSITEDEARQIIANGFRALPNPHARVKGSRLATGTTDGGRRLVLILDPHPYQPDEWFVMTGWDA